MLGEMAQPVKDRLQKPTVFNRVWMFRGSGGSL